MSYRKPDKKDFVGKTIAHVDTSSDNVLKFHFTDNTDVEVWSETIFTPAGNLPVLYVDD